ncbi:MAG TPA: DUF6599 family protein [Phycisphaerae bacterium]|nr:DUF6599 family protein [Phycisphaerae bacterium]
MPLFLAGGCDKLRPRPASAPAATPAGEEVLTNAPRGRDAEDDAKSPACLPQTQKNGTWVKKEPVRVSAPADLAKVLSPRDAQRCEFFRIKSAARCSYGLKRADATYARADVVYIETLTNEDAFGLLTCLCPSTETFRIGGETRVTHSGGLVLHCWQGRCYLKVSSAESDAETAEEMIRLLMHICGKIPGEGPPPILAALPADHRRPGKLWLARHLSSIPPDAIELGYPLDLQKVSAVLGLGKDTLIAVASYDVPNGARPNTVWIVEYPSVKAAADAYARYNRLITKTDDPIAVSASILPEQGTYVVGTWTAEEESMQYLLPKISKALPM